MEMQTAQLAAPETPKKQVFRLTRDDRIAVQALLDAGHTHARIAAQLSITIDQVRYVKKAARLTPQHKKAGRKSKISDSKLDEIFKFLKTSYKTRRLNPTQVCNQFFPDGSVHPKTLRLALRRRGLHRRIALRKPKLTEKHKEARLQFALDHIDSPPEFWKAILWSDETWICSGRNRKTWVWREAGEAYHEDCLIDKLKKKNAWMFWGSFYGNKKGPCFFWPKEKGKTCGISADTYDWFILPQVEEEISKARREQYPLLFQQDNASSHSCAATIAALERRGIPVFNWPAKSPDLSLIEDVWRTMKDWISKHYPDYKSTPSYNQKVVQEAWIAVRSDFLEAQLQSMPARLQAVINAKGGYTPF